MTQYYYLGILVAEMSYTEYAKLKKQKYEQETACILK